MTPSIRVRSPITDGNWNAFSAIEWSYRPEVDGLRAIAIIAVLLSHLKVPWLGGGYAGVDMFFVISGYIISGDLLNRVRHGDSSLVGFYIRRVRRLVPNLVVMAFVTLAASVIIFLPDDLWRMPLRVIASIFGFSNWLFANQAGYFQPASEWNPLLHTWTLAVEFQFYLIVPFIVFTLSRFDRKKNALIILALLVTSLCYAAWPRGIASSWHFYDSFARAWEFLIGIALNVARPPKLPRILIDIIAGLGLLILIFCFTSFNRDAFYPDLRTLAPTIATAALLGSTRRGSGIGRVLASKAMVAVGKGSYSLYLWHWPIIVFANYLQPGSTERPVEALLIIGLIGLASALGYRYVEVPLRSSREASDKLLPGLVYTSIASFAVVAVGIYSSKGFPARFGEDERTIIARGEAVSSRRDVCHRDSEALPIDRSCRFGAKLAPRVAMWSDSHGVEIMSEMAPQLAIWGISAELLSYSSCPPRRVRKSERGCERFNQLALRHILSEPTIETVILAAAMDNPGQSSAPGWEAQFRGAVRAIVASGRHVILVYPVPRQTGHVPRMLVNQHRYGFDSGAIATTHAAYLSRNREVFAVYDSLVGSSVASVRPDAVLCSSGVCISVLGGFPLYYDDNHLNVYGARLIAPAILRLLPSTLLLPSVMQGGAVNREDTFKPVRLRQTTVTPS